MTIATATVPQEVRAISLIGFAHFLSHFYMLCLPPLFVVLNEDLGISFVELGVILTVYNAATAILQTPMGLLVDRVGARRVLICGLFVNALAIALAGMTSSYWELLVLFLLAGAGNAVFHPADFVILTASVGKQRQGRAYSIHSFGGTLGFAAAPATMTLLTQFMDWRPALMLVGMIGMVLSLVFVFFGHSLRQDAKTRARPNVTGTLRQFFRRGVILFFLFYVATSAAGIGLSAFSPVFLPALYGMSVEAANFTLSAMLVATAVGTLFGGPLADWTRRHDLVLLVAFVISTLLVFVVGTTIVPALAAALALAVAGFCRGVVNPSRDIMVRETAPPGLLGSVFAFVSTGFNLGQGLAPLLYGALLDGGRFNLVLYFAAGFTLLAVLLLPFSRDRRL